MLTHNFKIINDPSQWDEDMKNFFNSLAEYWLSMHPKPNRRWREEYAMKLYKQLNGVFIEIFARWKIYFSNYCIECGRQLEGDLKYCPWCGMDRSMDSAVDESPSQPFWTRSRLETRQILTLKRGSPWNLMENACIHCTGIRKRFITNY